MGQYKEIFDFAAKLGCLEGYLYERPDAGRSYLPNWVGNIERMYGALPEEVKEEFRAEYAAILEKIAGHAEKILPPDDPTLAQIRQMIAKACP